LKEVIPGGRFPVGRRTNGERSAFNSIREGIKGKVGRKGEKKRANKEGEDFRRTWEKKRKLRPSSVASDWKGGVTARGVEKKKGEDENEEGWKEVKD